MTKGATTLSDVKEHTWTEAIGTAAVGIGLMLLGALLFYFVKYLPGGPAVRMAVRLGFGVAIFAGAGILGLAILRTLEVRRTPTVKFSCPYCDNINLFPKEPTEDFNCEHCNRTVHFENGVMVPVRTIICQACRTEHRVPTNVQRYVCDRCNRPLQISSDITQQLAKAGSDGTEALLQNYNVLLMAFDKRQENELTFKLQNLMVITLPEARRLLSTVGANTPLIVAYNEPQRKAEAIRRQLQELGATATIRASGPAAAKTKA